MCNNRNIKVSVITVCYNAENQIEKTIKSVIEQEYNNFEYIIVDGKSSDSTINIIKQYNDFITKWISEKDSGIYNAMNKAINLSNGEYCIFMNAGDIFANNLVLSKIDTYLDGNTDVILGNYIATKNNKFNDYIKAPKIIDFSYLYIGSICHQATFIKRENLINTPYDESLRLVSDWKFWLEVLIIQNKTYKGVDIDICIFNKEGLTYQMKETGLRERDLVLNSLFPRKVLNDYAYLRTRNIPLLFFKRLLNRIKYELNFYKKYLNL